MIKTVRIIKSIERPSDGASGGVSRFFRISLRSCGAEHFMSKRRRGFPVTERACDCRWYIKRNF